MRTSLSVTVKGAVTVFEDARFSFSASAVDFPPFTSETVGLLEQFHGSANPISI